MNYAAIVAKYSILVKKTTSCYCFINMQTFAILGSHPKLSIAEIEALIGNKLSKTSDQVAVFENEINANKLQSILGGTQKLGEILGSVKDHQELEHHLFALLLEKSGDGKLEFGISVYDIGAPKRTKEIQKYMHKVGIAIKKSVKESGQSVRLVTSNEPTLSTVVVKKNKLITKGIEFVLLVEESEIHIGVTRAIQDFEDWSHRDYDRPKRDAKSGMLPPKLARIMVNLAGVDPKKSYLLDPFCGSGTILMEASLLGFDNVIGSDISQKAINDTRANLNWLMQQNYQIADHTLICSSADYLNDKLEKASVDVIITEPYLGNPRSGKEKIQEIEYTIKTLTNLYKASFKELDAILKPNGIVVVASPVHYIKEQAFPVPTADILENLGYKAIFEPLLYKREDQFVGRSILVFKK
jgi:tRNA (guanine10-N2)-dimethyltransferase